MTKGSDQGQAGNALPLESTQARTLVQESTTVDALTITLSCGVTDSAGGQGLVVRRNYYAGTSGGTELFVTEWDGVRGYRHVEYLATGSSALTLTSTQSGALLVIDYVATGGMTYTLPDVTGSQGLWYEFFVKNSPASGVITIQSATAGDLIAFSDTAANAWVFGKDTTASGTQIGQGARFYSNGTKWMVVPQPGYTSAAPTSATMNEVAIVT